jgi:hypothetical protein
MPLFLLLLLGLGGVYLFTRKSAAAVAGAGTSTMPLLPPGSQPAHEAVAFESPEADALAPLPANVQIEVAQVLGSAGADPNIVMQLATAIQTQVPNATSIVALLQQKARELASGTPGSRDMFVVAPSGLNIRSAPNVQADILGYVPFGKTVRVLEISSDGWAKIQSLTTANVGFACNDCKEDPGVWLVDVPPPPQPQQSAIAPQPVARPKG